MAQGNNGMSMNRQVISNRFYVAQSVVAEFTKMLKTLSLTQISNQSYLRRKLWLFYVCLMFVMRKTQINYAPNFEEVEVCGGEGGGAGAYWFGPVRGSVCACVTLAYGQEQLEIHVGS